MAKIRLGQRPKNFKRTVKFHLVDGSEAAIEVTYKYRTRSEFGAFIDKMRAETGDTVVPLGDDGFSMAALMEKTAGSNADFILQVAEGWNLIDEDDKPVEFTRDTIQQLADEYPVAATAVMDTYRVAVTGARLGN